MAEKKKITRTALKGFTLKNGKQAIYWDSLQAGFGVRVSPGRMVNGKKQPTYTFMVQARCQGKEIKVTIGRYPEFTPEGAREKAAEYLRMMRNGEDPRDALKAPKQDISLGDMLTAYIDILEARGKTSTKAVKNQVEKDIKRAFPRLWNKPAAKVTLDDCIRIISSLKDEGKPRQADKLRTYIRAAYATAINSRNDLNAPQELRDMRIAYNPVGDLRKIEGASKADPRCLTLSEFRAFWSRAKKLPEPSRSIVILFTLTGGRWKQLSRATLQDFDRDTGTLTLMDLKGRRSEPRAHVIPLTDLARQALDNLAPGHGGFIFSCNGGRTPCNDDYVTHYVRNICSDMAKAGELEKGPFRPKHFRKTIESLLAAPPYRQSSDVLKHVLSHGFGGVQDKHYQRYDYLEEKQRAFEMVERMLENHPEPSADVIEMRARA